MTASYTNTDGFNKSRRALTFPVMTPSTWSTIYSPLQNHSSSRLIPEHYSSTCYSSFQNLPISHTMNTRGSLPHTLRVRNSISRVHARKGLWHLWLTKWYCDRFVSQLPLFPPGQYHSTTLSLTVITNAESSYKLTASVNSGSLRTRVFGKYVDLRQ